MATALIKVGGVVGRPAVTKTVGDTIALTNNDNTGVASWLWSVVFAPAGSTAAFVPSGVVAAPTLGVLNKTGTYWIRLAVNGATGDWKTDPEVDEVVVRVRAATGIPGSPPAVGETDQGGAQGWADETTGMNALLLLLLAGNTLQSVYNQSSPPLISISAALDALRVQRVTAVAGPGEILRLEDAATTRLSVRDDGRISSVVAHAGGAFFGWDLDNQSVGGQGIARLRNTLTGGIFSLDSLGSVGATAIGATRGLDLDAQGCASIFRVRDSLGSGGDPLSLLMLATGQLSAASKSATYGLLVDAKAATTGVANLINTTNANQQFLVRADGAVFVRPKVAPANTVLALQAETVNDFFSCFNPATGRLLQLAAECTLWINATVAAGLDGFSIDYASIDAGATSLFRIGSTVGTPLMVYPSGRLLTTPEGGLAESGGSWDGMRQDWATVASVANGESRRGLFVDGASLAVNAGGVFYGVEAAILGVVAGTASAFRARVTTQAVPAYKVGTGAAGTAFLGRVRFSAADAVSASGVNQWALGVLSATGTTSSWVASAGSIFLLIPLRLPPGSTLQAASVHVLPAGGGGGACAKMTLYVLEVDALWGGSADQQTLLGSIQSTAVASEQDIALTGLGIAVPRDEAANWKSYYLAIESGQNADVFYSGYVQFSYTELLLGC